ncbi:AAA family ATPase [Natrialbaceae archaeon AArc-T1-2]|uniref:AAA family ATPase n=1 Tax=Natrialbaceae archaeon AArc-T1-2 TaxID=3053904 RepID=UPI00255AB044|nr:MoxR family ATPase [Natrialbaceae archaeon AArc-T1-2]WIV68860.1 MoxR family ATPase [Natrialbaceae archaeon AArc-T1-2]
MSERSGGSTVGSDGQTVDPETVHERVRNEVGNVLVGNEVAIEHLSIGLLIGGHVLLEGVPGVAKTTLVKLFSRATGLEYSRTQMTPDTLPADVTGTSIYRENLGEFELQRGPIFANLVLVDEINRATPKTQSALLEAMEEGHVTIETETLELPDPFMVVATQNPIEMEGVFELPEAQRDRFQFKLTIELPDRSTERELLERFDDDPDLGPDDTEQVVNTDDIRSARDLVTDVHVSSPVKSYILNLVAETRSHPDVAQGASPRASLTFLHAAKARAAIRGREYVIPDDVKGLAEPVLTHRLVLNTEAELGDVSPTDVVSSILEAAEPPSAEVVRPEAVNDADP